MTLFDSDAAVRHPRFGRGQVVLSRGDSVVVRFDHGIEECLAADLELLEGLAERMAAQQFDPALPVVTRILAECIRSVNDAWGVFSRSRIALLPHQLWVCKRVLETWPTRWLVADDVGLGKTIEAGLILTPLLSSARVRRLLILAPASLVEQWQVRLREMFDIRISNYVAAADTEAADYWNTQDRIIASAHTLRLDTDNRWRRLFEAKPWDLVLVDEAHHMNVDERGQRTLSYQLLEGLEERGKIQSLVLFTGTPHRGKDGGFLSLLKLLRPGEFDPEQPLEDQLERLRTVMIRNNKQSVTDMSGQPLFTPVRSRRETYAYSPQEAHFYEQLTQFIMTGKAYAASLGFQDRRMVILILITMQKLASSSVAAVRRALARRLDRLRLAKTKLDDSRKALARLQELRDEDDPANLDEISRLEERIAESLSGVDLNPDEIPALEELLVAANEVTDETKIERILAVVDESFAKNSVLFFTEYKATQALLMSALHVRYGDGCVAFINGDGLVEDVWDSSGNISDRQEDRRRAAEQFNRGEVRFLVSTEAAGEGVDLQGHCSALIHVDLPWNPMRLHQRVGRLSRYGQTESVDVITVRNPDTVESRIWDLLDEKLARINLAFQSAMDDPEDIRQLVIGMASPGMFTKVFTGADAGLGDQTLDDWFDTETATFGGEDAVNTVRSIVGHVARFDFGTVAAQIPQVDLPDLVPFFKAILAVRGRRPEQAEDVRLRFRPPDEWKDDFAIAVVDRYDLLFAREPKPSVAEDIAGVGLRVVDRAVSDALGLTVALAAIKGLDAPIFVFTVRDRITGSDSSVRSLVVAAQSSGDGAWELIRDWELIQRLNPLADRPRSLAITDVRPNHDVLDMMTDARAHVVSQIAALEVPFELPLVENLACLVPGAAAVPEC
ncbi:MAG: DEAD/DEAH box helicase [Bryobacterales bacterium]|nr:DEAD/DEAH box helicase [Bryobacterales bacterium]